MKITKRQLKQLIKEQLLPNDFKIAMNKFNDLFDANLHFVKMDRDTLISTSSLANQGIMKILFKEFFVNFNKLIPPYDKADWEVAFSVEAEYKHHSGSNGLTFGTIFKLKNGKWVFQSRNTSLTGLINL